MIGLIVAVLGVVMVLIGVRGSHREGKEKGDGVLPATVALCGGLFIGLGGLVLGQYEVLCLPSKDPTENFVYEVLGCVEADGKTLALLRELDGVNRYLYEVPECFASKHIKYAKQDGAETYSFVPFIFPPAESAQPAQVGPVGP